MTKNSVKSVILLLAIFLGGLLVPATAFCAKKPVKIGILANGGVDKVFTMWSATADYLNDLIPGYSFSVVPLDFGNIGPAVGRSEVDFVLTNSSNYVELETLYGASRILTLINRTGTGARTVFGGVIFCRRDRKDINGLDDLKGKSFIAVAENSLGGWQAAWRELRDKGINPYSAFTSLRFGQTQDAVVHAVRDGTVDAGTVRTDTLERMSDKGKIDLSEFHILNRQSSNEFPFALSTRLYPEWPFAKLKHTDNTLAQKVIIALLRMPSDSPAAKAGQIVGWTIPLDYRPVHELMRELQIGPYKSYGKVTLISAVRQHWYWFVSGMLATLFMAGATVYVLHLNRKLVQSRQLLERAHSGLERQLRFTQTLLGAIPLAAFYKDTEGRFLGCNNEFAKIMGITPEDIVGKTAFDLWPGEQAQTYHGKDIELLQNPAYQIYEYKVTGHEGKTLDVIYYKDVFRDENGMVRGIIGTFVDITERKLMEAALRQSEEKFRTLFEAAVDALIILDMDGNFIDVNRTAYERLGYTKAEMLSMNISQLDHPDFADKIAGRMEHLQKHGWCECESAHLRKDGAAMPVEINARFMDFQGNKVIFSIVRDISERKKIEAELRIKQQQLGELNATLEQRVQEEIASRQEKEQLLLQQSRMAAMGEMIGAIAHQWRQPLNVIGLIIQNLQIAYEYGEMDKERLNNAVATAMWQINFMSKTIDDFRNFFKSSKEKEIFDVRKLVDETIFLMKAQLQNNYIDIDVIVEKEGIVVKGYPNEFQHVLLNLINNAKDAILLRKAKENCRAELTIRDLGKGR